MSGFREYGKKNDVNIKGERNEWEETTVILAMAFPQTYTWENCISTIHMPYFVGGHIQVNGYTWSWGGVNNVNGLPVKSVFWFWYCTGYAR